jgi:hypothetical protein
MAREAQWMGGATQFRRVCRYCRVSLGLPKLSTPGYKGLLKAALHKHLKADHPKEFVVHFGTNNR